MPNSVVWAINQNATTDDLRRQVEAQAPERLLILCTHQPYPDEADALIGLASDVELVTFADILREEEMIACDEEASRQGRAELEKLGRRRYSDYFMRLSLRLKNERVLEKVGRLRPDARLYHLDGLGVDGQAWRAAGSIPMELISQGERRGSFKDRLQRILDGEVYLLTGERAEQRALVLGSLKRIPLAPSVRVRRLPWRPMWGVMPERINASLLHFVLRLRGVRSVPAIHTSVHQYHLDMTGVSAGCGQRLAILIDGHHPSNYPASYIELFGEGEFVAANPLSAEWFRRHGRSVVPGEWLLAPCRFRSCSVSPIRRVMLVLNHAGDWSALIERSDTDRLVLGFVEIARRWPHLEFVVRVHPTMATARHEGVNSIRRIARLIIRTELQNLRLSDRPLEEDLDRADLYLSEYSQVLIDAWQSGKLGASVNLTRRRSFMSDYNVLGFHRADSVDGLDALIRGAVKGPERMVAQQNHAVERFNAVASRWRTQGVVDLETPVRPRRAK